jgi:hypothetical protein
VTDPTLHLLRALNEIASGSVGFILNRLMAVLPADIPQITAHIFHPAVRITIKTNALNNLYERFIRHKMIRPFICDRQEKFPDDIVGFGFGLDPEIRIPYPSNAHIAIVSELVKINSNHSVICYITTKIRK